MVLSGRRDFWEKMELASAIAETAGSGGIACCSSVHWNGEDFGRRKRCR